MKMFFLLATEAFKKIFSIASADANNQIDLDSICLHHTHDPNMRGTT